MPATGWPFITSVFSFIVPGPKKIKKNRSLYYYVKLFLWKHTSAPSLAFTFTGQAWLNSAFRRGGWETAFIEARCVPTSCPVMFLDRAPQPDHNMLGSSPNAGKKHASVLTQFAPLIFRVSWLEDKRWTYEEGASIAITIFKGIPVSH